MNLLLDDKIYLLQKASLPKELAQKVKQADLFYLKDNERMAENILKEIENECSQQGIPFPY